MQVQSDNPLDGCEARGGDPTSAPPRGADMPLALFSAEASALIRGLSADLEWFAQVGQQARLRSCQEFLRFRMPEGHPLVTGRTENGAIVLELGDRYRDACLAVRALKTELVSLGVGHDGSAMGCVATPTVPKPGPDLNDPVRAEGR